MTQLRRLPVRLGDLSLGGLPWEPARDKVESYINGLLGHARDRVVVLPKMDKSTDPESGELLFDGVGCWIAIDGEYKPLWPHPEAGTITTITEEGGPAGGGEEPSLRTIYWVGLAWSSESFLLLVEGVAGKRIRVGYLEISNGSSADVVAHLRYQNYTQELCKCFLQKSGGAVIQNFFGTELIDGDVGDRLFIYSASAVTATVYVTVGYFLE